MKRVVAALSVAVALASAAALPLAAAPGAAPRHGREVVGYFIQWGIYGRQYFVKNVDTSGSADKLTVLNYAFGNVAPDAGKVVCQSGDPWADYQRPVSADESVDGREATSGPLLGNFQQLRALKELHPHLKVLISLGGWTWSKYFSDAALTDESRATLVSSCIDLFVKGNLPDAPGAAAGVFDGIDLDWEWPGSEGNAGNIIRAEDRANFTKLAAEFRKQLDDLGAGYLLTAFLPAAPAKIDAGFEVGKIFESLDFATVQGYDLHGAWESSTNHQSNLYASKNDPSSPRFSVADTVQAYLDRGAPASQLVVGVPFYSRGWTGVAPAGKGLYQPATGAAPGTWEAGVDDYKVVKQRLGEGYERFWDGHAFASWLFDGTTFWTFDDPKSMKHKAHFVLDKGLGGLMFWELSGDTPDGELIGAIADGLSHGSAAP
jgi:chitinase